MTNESGNPCLRADIAQICPFDVQKIPVDTAQLIESVQRESRLAAQAPPVNLRRASHSQMIKILGVIAEGSRHGLCTVYRVQVIDIDNRPVTSAPLCLKLFDDRFLPLRYYLGAID